jgi:hypothetical protein
MFKYFKTNRLPFAVILNVIFLSISYWLYNIGVIDTAIKNDIMYVTPTIFLVFLLGMIGVPTGWKLTYWCSETTINLGFVGTLLGIWTAFSAIDIQKVTDATAIIPIIVTLIYGLGAAIWTTLAGLYFYVWLTANMELFDKEGAGNEKT